MTRFDSDSTRRDPVQPVVRSHVWMIAFDAAAIAGFLLWLAR